MEEKRPRLNKRQRKEKDDAGNKRLSRKKPQSEKPKTAENENKERLREIMEILRKHEITKGLSPVKVRQILEDLGPTFIKLGQIMSMRSDIIPKNYCEELENLRTNVPPMPIEQVRQVIEESCGSSIHTLFASFEETPLGSASIAQAHKATLKDGSSVVVKVQRIGIFDTMSRDIALLRRAAGIMKLVGGVGEILDFGMILDELWNVAQEEMNFLVEAKNLEQFREMNRDIAYVTCPAIYKHLTTSEVLVMEYIEGHGIDEKDALLEDGYDLNEIGTKLADNYCKQVLEDGFFHADPHPGNIRVRDGQIVWIDLGMMGHLNARDQKLLSKAIVAVAQKDIGTIKDVILTMGVYTCRINHSKLYADIEDLLTKYGSADIGTFDMGKMLEEILLLAKGHHIAMPSGVSMLGRGVITIEGVLSQIAPELNFVQVTVTHMKQHRFHDIDWQKELFDVSQSVLKSGRKILDIPALAADLLSQTMKGQTKVNMEMQVSDDLKQFTDKIVGKIIMGLLVAALLVGSSLLCTTDMEVKLFNIPALGAIGFIVAFLISLWIIYDSFRKKI